MITLYRFPYSCYALKVQYLLDKLALEYETVDVPFADRTALVELTGGRVVVPAIAHDDRVVVESRDICEYLLGLTDNTLVPDQHAALIWAYADWSDTLLEDTLFRIASPGIATKFAIPFETALFIFVKERKFGAGCVQQWEQSQAELIKQAQVLLGPSLKIITAEGFVAGDRLTFADISLMGHLAMVEYADPALIGAIAPSLVSYMQRFRSA